ncbi:7 transmembrane receptor (rhodopsin family) domain-containing protein [Ditylenchus destructor]|uniref:7 transmembrane receptor (Rhodopsin family) domain-containing protein n=1 Tax=Ditylenchus destructor TaxID=166010 RepID=A0AAD4MPU3_9BILA|nr:7 transmembrane receptor (rhodopsin family) domain-containing protein [Ditylenchus destructor]
MFHVVGSMNGHWPLGNMVCKLYVLVLHLVPCTGIGILICVSLEKYIAVLHPLLALKLLTPKLRVGMMIAIWTISLVINLPYYFTTKELQFGELASCARDMSGYGSISTRDIITVSFVVWYCIPLATIAFLYTRIGMVLWKGQFKPLTIRYSNDTYSTGSAATTATTLQVCSNGETGTTLTPGALNGGSKVHDEGQQGTGGGSTIYSEVLESRKKIIRLLIAIVSSFAILTFPHHARLLYLMYTHGEMCTSSWTALVQPATYLCLFLSSSVNPFLYAFMSQRFRGAVRDLLKCRVGKMQRKYTRTRTLLSDVISSRSPSLTRLNAHHHYTPSSSANNLNATHQNGHSNFLNHFLSVKSAHGHSHQKKQQSLMVENGAKMKLIRSESGDPTPGYRTRQNKNDAKRSNKSLYRNSRI